MLNLAGKSQERLPYYLRDLPNNFPCFVETPSGGLHLLFKYAGSCKVATLSYGEHKLEVKHSNSTLSLGEKENGVYVLRDNPLEVPDLPLFLIELINPQPKQRTVPITYRRKNKPGLEKILNRVLTVSTGNNDAQKKFAWRSAYFGYGVEETISFVKSRPDAFGNDSDTEVVINHAWHSNTERVAV
jgi:hypothetical protein